MPAMKVDGDSDGDGDMSGVESERSGASSGCADRDSSAEEADEPDSDDSSEMDEGECERRRNECMDNLAHLERQFTVLREQLYRERVSQVEWQVSEVRGGRSRDYLAPLQRLQENMRARIEVAGVLRQMRLENVKNKYDAEEQAAVQNFKSEKCLVWDSLQDELLDKIRRLEEDRQNVDLGWTDWGTSERGGAASLGASTLTTNATAGTGTNQTTNAGGRARARRKAVTVTGPCIIYMLAEQDIMEDWATIRKALKRTLA